MTFWKKEIVWLQKRKKCEKKKSVNEKLNRKCIVSFLLLLLDVYIGKDLWCHDAQIVSGQIEHPANVVVGAGQRQDRQADKVDVDEKVVDVAVAENVAAGDQSADPSSGDADGGVDHLESCFNWSSTELDSCQQPQAWQVRELPV